MNLAITSPSKVFNEIDCVFKVFTEFDYVFLYDVLIIGFLLGLRPVW